MFGFFSKKDQPDPHLPPPVNPLKSPGQEQAPKRTKLKLMTQHEEKERAYLAAREHALQQSLPDLKQVRQTKIRNETYEFVVQRTVLAIAFFFLVLGCIWVWNNLDTIDGWWKSLLESIKII